MFVASVFLLPWSLGVISFFGSPACSTPVTNGATLTLADISDHPVQPSVTCCSALGSHILVADCVGAFQQIVAMPGGWSPDISTGRHDFPLQDFSPQAADRRFRLPQRFSHRSCVIVIDGTATATSWQQLGEEAMHVVTECVHRSGIGGEYDSPSGISAVVVNPATLPSDMQPIWHTATQYVDLSQAMDSRLSSVWKPLLGLDHICRSSS